ncbi:MAG TPA: LicD family protein [Firmicutes bacterium]|nr:LicD family protein [Bacillota bacterium]
MDLLKEIQKTELGALVELRRVCEKNNIRYFLAQGTLIGAARERGFIPWDDDVDVILPDKDLKRLIEIFPREADGKYMITNHNIESHYPLSWPKIRIKNTLSRPIVYKDIPINWGMCIDLFPIYSVSDNPLLRKLEIGFFKIARKALLSEMTRYEDGRDIITRLFEKIPIRVRHRLMNTSAKIFGRHGDDTEYVYVICKGGSMVKRDVIFGKEQKLTFEGLSYPVPSDYDGFLRAQFGDYMTPPPENERKGHDMRLGEIEWRLSD